jgi:hypothetical protein
LPNFSTTDDDHDTVPTTIEGLMNGVVVGFNGVAGNPAGLDAGVWDNPSIRAIPLCPSSPE